MSQIQIHNNRHEQNQRFGRLCFGGIKTGAGMYIMASLFEHIIKPTDKTNQKIFDFVKKSGKLGLGLSTAALVGTILYDNI